MSTQTRSFFSIRIASAMAVSFVLGAIVMWLLMNHLRIRSEQSEVAQVEASPEPAGYAGGGFDLTLPLQSDGADGGKSQAELMKMLQSLGATEEEARETAGHMIQGMKKYEQLIPQLSKDTDWLPKTTTTTRVEKRIR